MKYCTMCTFLRGEATQSSSWLLGNDENEWGRKRCVIFWVLFTVYCILFGFYYCTVDAPIRFIYNPQTYSFILPFIHVVPLLLSLSLTMFCVRFFLLSHVYLLGIQTCSFVQLKDWPSHFILIQGKYTVNDKMKNFSMFKSNLLNYSGHWTGDTFHGT